MHKEGLPAICGGPPLRPLRRSADVIDSSLVRGLFGCLRLRRQLQHCGLLAFTPVQKIPMVGASWWSKNTGWVEPGRAATTDGSYRAQPPPHYLSGGQGPEPWRAYTTRGDRWSNNNWNE
jgi:hypothetical protein